MYWVPLMSASPSLASSVTGARSRAPCVMLRRAVAALPVERRFALAVSTSARWASGARSPEAPDRALRRDARNDVGVEHLDEPIDDHCAHARVAERDHLRAEEHDGADLGRREIGADAARMSAEQILLECAHVGGEMRTSLSAPKPVLMP